MDAIANTISDKSGSFKVTINVFQVTDLRDHMHILYGKWGGGIKCNIYI